MKTTIMLLSAFGMALAISTAEDQKKPNGPHKPNPKHRLEKMDTDGNGSISLQEFQATPKGQENPERAEKFFKHLDKDGNGELSVDELARMHQGPGGPEGNPKERFEKADADGNGSISLSEFQSTPRAKENPERAAEIFQKIDADGNGEITKEEMAKAHQMRPKPGDRPEKRGERDESEDDNVQVD